MIDPTMLMPKKPKGEGMREIARMIMSGQPIKPPNKRIVDAFTPAEQRRYDGLGLGNKMLVDDEMQRGAPMWQTLDGAPPLPQDPAVPPLGDGGSPIENEDPRGMFYDIEGRFLDDQAYQVADASGGIQPFGAGDDSVLSRQMAGEEMGFRAAASRLDNIDAMLRENEDLLDSLTFGGNMRRRALQLKDKFGFELGEDGEEYLTDTTVFRQNILRNINRTIQEVTGAQMGEEEAERIRAEMPDVDAGPVEFKAKLAAAMNMVRMDIARINYWRQQGGTGNPDEVTDAELRNAMQQAGRQYYEQAISSGMSPADARLEAARLLSEEFGI